MICSKCDSGLIHAKPKDNPKAGFYVFKCDCPLGEARKEAYPQWDNREMFKWMSHKKYMEEFIKKEKL